MRDQYVAVCRESGDYETNGFAHLNAAAAELVVEEIRDQEITARQPSAQDDAQEQRCTPPNKDVLCARVNTLDQAASLNCLERAQELLAKSGIDSTNGSESEALRTAIRHGYEPIVRILLDAGAPINPPGFFPPLEEAARSGNLNILKMVIARGADVNHRDGRGATYLASFSYFEPEAMKILLEAGADPNSRDRDGQTALMHAAYFGYESSVRILLQHKADVNLTDPTGRTALMQAAAGKYIDAIEPLLSAGASLNAVDHEGKTALDIAKASKNLVAVEVLTAGGGSSH